MGVWSSGITPTFLHAEREFKSSQDHHLVTCGPLGPLKPLTVMIADFPFETELSEPKVLFPIENPRSLKP